MSVVSLLILIALIGFFAWLLIKIVPMPAEIQKTIVAVAVVIVILIVLEAFGIFGSIQSVQVPKIR
jgi:hypothetical protein